MEGEQLNNSGEIPENPSETPHAIDAVIQKAIENQKPEAPLKRKVGRPRKNPIMEPAQAVAAEPIAPPAPPPDYTTMLRDLAGMASIGLVEWAGTDAAALTDEEKGTLAEGLNPLAQKWFPTMGEMTPEWAAIIAVSTVAFSVSMRVKAARPAPAAVVAIQGQA